MYHLQRIVRKGAEGQNIVRLLKLHTGQRRRSGLLAGLVLAWGVVCLRQADTASLGSFPADPIHVRPGIAMAAPGFTAGDACPLCRPDPSIPIVPLTPADADSLGRTYAAFNEAYLARMDSLLTAGAFGPPEKGESRRTAHLLTRMLTINSLHYMIDFTQTLIVNLGRYTGG